VAFFPAVWLVAYFFIKRSIALEEAEVTACAPANAPENPAS
jgi:hypothetical protein